MWGDMFPHASVVFDFSGWAPGREVEIGVKTWESKSCLISLPPGVERSPEELEQGQVDIYGSNTPYATKELTYTEANFDKLAKLCEYNILNNKDTLLQAMRLAVEKKKQLNSQCPP